MTAHVKITARSFPVAFDVGGVLTSIFDFDGVFWDAADLIVYVSGAALDPSAYAVTGLREQSGLPIVGGYGGGSVTLNTPVINTTVVIDRFVVDQRNTDYSTTAPLSLDALNSDLDRATARDQDIRAALASGGNVIVNPTSAVLSVNGHVGAVFLTAADVGCVPATGGAYTGAVTGVTAGAGDNTTKFATTAWVTTAIAALGGGVTLATSGTPADLGVAARGVGTHAARDDHVHNLPTPAAIGAAPAVVTTKGDLYTYGSAALRLAVGSNTQILQADSSQTSGLKWVDFSWANLTGKPSTFTPSAHTHVYTDVTNFAAGVIASCVAGSGVTLANVGGQLQISSSGGALPYHEYPAWENGITTGTLAATNVTNLQNLINTLNGGGGGEIVFYAAGSYQIDSTIFLKSDVQIRMAPGAYFLWVGAAGGTVFETVNTTVMIDADYQINVNEGASFSGTVFRLHSHQRCRFDLRAYGAQTAGGIFIHQSADSSGPGSAVNCNTAFFTIRAQHYGTCGYFLISDGVASGFGGNAQVVTDGSYEDLVGQNCLFRGLKLDNWTDTVTFRGNTLLNVTGANGGGLGVNEGRSGTPSVYNIHFEQLAVDTFGSGLSRFGVALFESKGITCDAFYQNPAAELGDFTGTACTSYQFRKLKSDDTIYIHQKAVSTGL
jgi:hypothetical protein